MAVPISLSLEVKGLAYMTLGLSNWDPKDDHLSSQERKGGAFLQWFYDFNSLIRLFCYKVGYRRREREKDHICQPFPVSHEIALLQ